MSGLAELSVAAGVVALVLWLLWPRRAKGERLSEHWRGWKRGGDGR